ncbi:hypothetical protein [Chryseobacterium sp. HR92]|uniref:hypothetical protein n=1 Tax=Chryseobacterium sp. HR92 TaxID=3094839 RepID=UPI00388D987C|nr:hypothetical protein SFA27_22625 [Chryseobacterium sp. HR92]
MRDNFTSKTKEILAKRVAWRCSFLGCRRITVGAGHKSSSHVINLGEAAHIYAASPEGPRYDEKMTKEQRISIENGIWLCRQHARIIDSDYSNYSAETLIQWKLIAEKEAINLLKTLERESISLPTTFLSIGSKIVVEAIWKSVNNGVWQFEIQKFILGEINDIRVFNDESIEELRYIVIETQGDGRMISGDLNWEIIDGRYNISLTPKEKSPRTTPYNLQDISEDFEIENGDFKIVKGEDCAKQIIKLTLSTGFGDLKSHPMFGSLLSYYYQKFKNNISILNRLIKLEITRLISIPYADKLQINGVPPLDFINRIINVEIGDIEIFDSKLPIKVKLEWGDYKHWESIIEIYINEN